MDSISMTLHTGKLLPLPAVYRPAAFKPLSGAYLKPPLKPLSSKPRNITLRASSNPSPSSPNKPQTVATLSAFIKPACIALAASAVTATALFLFQRQKPSLPAAPLQPPTTVSSNTHADEEQERALEAHLLSHPDDPKSLRALMELKIKSRKFPEAIAIVDRLILLDPSENGLHLVKAHLQSYSGDGEAAKQGFEEVLSRNPFVVEAYHGLVMVMSQSDTDEDLSPIVQRVQGVMETCEKEKRKEELRDFKLLVAQVRVIEGQYLEALKNYQELVREEPKDFRPYLCQGFIYSLLGKKDEAERQFGNYRRLVPEGHPYTQFFDDNMVAMKAFSQMEEGKRANILKS